MKGFHGDGYAHIEGSSYLGDEDWPQYEHLLRSFDNLVADPSPGQRTRRYARLVWNRATSELRSDHDQSYFQTAAANSADGGHARDFAAVESRTIANGLLAKVLRQDLALARHWFNLRPEVTVGVHQIRYAAAHGSVSFSSPAWLHYDDEPLVFVHLVKLHAHAIGGDNVIAHRRTHEIQRVIRLEQPFDTLALNQGVLHAVTPHARRYPGPLPLRDILLVTIEKGADTVEHAA